MKVECSSCGAQHCLPDAQLGAGASRVVCPRCTTELYVDSSMIRPDALEAKWYVAINDESVGPLSAQDLELYFHNGNINLDSYVWADGLPDWVALKTLPDLAYLSSTLESEAAESEEATRVAAFPVFSAGGQETEAINVDDFRNSLAAQQSGYSPFADAQPKGIVGMDGQEASDDDFQFDMSPMSAPASPGPFGSANDLIGARSENSVLFSLSSLQAVSSGKAQSVAESGAVQPPSSGLIDVKALASSGPNPRRRSFDNSSAGYGGAVMPMTTMLPLGNKKDNTPLYIALAVVSTIILGGLIVLIVMFVASKDDGHSVQSAHVDTQAVDRNAIAADLGVKATAPEPKPEASAENKDTEPEKKLDDSAAAPAAADEGDKAGEEADKQQAAAPVEAKPEAKPAEDAKADDSKAGDSRRRRDRDSRSAETKPKAEPKPAEKPKAETKPAATKPAEKPKVENKPAAAPAAASLSKDEVQGVIRSNFGQIRTCSRMSDKKGTMSVSFVIRGNGRVGSARVNGGEFAGTPVAACVLKVVNGMKFREFGGKDLPITYPFQIQ